MSQDSISPVNPLEHSQFSEYEILYTTNIVQKSKVWHDGRCKFFNFNKKLIVFSDDNIVIGTHFLGNPKVLESRDKQIRISDELLITIENKLGDFERDVSMISARDKRKNVTDLEIVNKRVPTRTPEKENIAPRLKKLAGSRRVGLSKTLSPSYISKLKRSPLTLRNCKTSPLQVEKINNFNATPSKVKNHTKVDKMDVGIELTINSSTPSLVETSLPTPASIEKVKKVPPLYGTPTHSKKSKIDVYASDDDQNVSEELSDDAFESDDDLYTQTKTYLFNRNLNQT